MLGESESALFYLLVSVFHILWFKWRSTVDQCKHDDSETPNINFITMTLGLKNLWSDVVRCSTYRLFLLTIEVNFRGESKIPNFNRHVLTEKKIAQLEIPMNNFLSMQILQSFQNLQHEISDLALTKSSSLLDHIVESLHNRNLTLFVHISRTIYTLRLS